MTMYKVNHTIFSSLCNVDYMYTSCKSSEVIISPTRVKRFNKEDYIGFLEAERIITADVAVELL